eukprot:1139770-Pelagomonas_calceolata.AAC.1
MLGSGSFQSGKRVGIRADFIFNKMNVPVLRRDLSRTKVGRWAWDRAHRESVRAALVPGREASVIREYPVRESSGDVLRDFNALFQGSHLGRYPYQ